MTMPAEHRKVIAAASLGALFEWYDFYLYGVLAPLLAQRFFAAAGEGFALVGALLAFAAGFVVRPLGALVFGRLGDLIGRKYTFLVTLLLMGGATFAIGLLPGHEAIGVAAPVALVLLRLLQGLAIGGEYGGVVTYVAEHAPRGRRGFYTGWIQATATLGLLLALAATVGLRAVLGEEAFSAWGWRLPFLSSAVLLAIGIWVRLSLQESPLFLAAKRAGQTSRSPLTEAFGRTSNLKRVLAALFGLVMGQAVVWYTGQFQALYFMTLQLKVDEATAALLLGTALALGSPLIVGFAALSDRIGRKPIVLAGCVLAALAWMPLFDALTAAANPALAQAQQRVSVRLRADPAQCAWRLERVGDAGMQACDVARRWLAERTVRFTDHPSATGDTNVTITIDGASPIEIAGDDASVQQRLNAALDTAGYPRRADPMRIAHAKVIGLLFVLMVFVAMVYGPIAALLVEMFPTRVRCSSVSLPYHLGNGWFGGLLPSAVLAIGAQHGSPTAGLVVPIAIALCSAAIGALVVRERREPDL